MSETLTDTRTRAGLDRHRIESLPIVILHVHSRCNCRCTMCDIWQNPQAKEISADDVMRMLPSLDKLGVRWVVLTGGEPLLHGDLASICTPLRARNIKVTLLTTGLLLSRYADRAADLFDEIIVSIDGPAIIHDRIRRVSGAFDRISAGITALHKTESAPPIRARTTVQKANHVHLRETVRAAKNLELDSISFLATDLTSTAFNRELVWPTARQDEVGLSLEETIALENEIERLVEEFREEIDGGFVVESPAKLRRVAEHFRAHLGLTTARAPFCSAPWHSAVIELDGNVRPCFFQPTIGNVSGGTLEAVVNGPTALQFRSALDIEDNPICQRCVCSLNYRES